jgi:hypothetical protein
MPLIKYRWKKRYTKVPALGGFVHVLLFEHLHPGLYELTHPSRFRQKGDTKTREWARPWQELLYPVYLRLFQKLKFWNSLACYYHFSFAGQKYFVKGCMA